MNEFTISEVKKYHSTLIVSEPFVVSGYYDFNPKQRTKTYRYGSLIDFTATEKISILEGEELLHAGVFYRLEVQPYFQKNSNEIALKVIKVVTQDEYNLIYNYKHFSIIKKRLEKGIKNIDKYFSSILASKEKINIGIITLKNSVAFDDIQKVLLDENKKYINKQVIMDINNIDLLQQKNIEDKVDVWIITRGGGNLSFFNSYNILKFISFLEKPLITALGHSTDYTLTDFMADRVFSTPTAFGEYLNKKIVSYKSEFEKRKFANDKIKNYNELLQKCCEQKYKINNFESELVAKEKEISKNLKEISNLKRILISREELIKQFSENMEVKENLNQIIQILNSRNEGNVFNKTLPPNFVKFIYFIIIVVIIKILIM